MKQKNKKITLEGLAIMVKRGFDETATKAELAELKSELKRDIKEVGDKVDHLEYLFNNNDRRLDLLADKVQVIGVKVGIK